VGLVDSKSTNGVSELDAMVSLREGVGWGGGVGEEWGESDAAEAVLG